MTNPGEVATEVLRWHAERRRFEPFAARFGITDVNAAYDVQDVLIRQRREERGAAPAGYKIGLTSPRMQAMCGVDAPIAGVVLAADVDHSGASIPVSRFVRLGIEFEVAVRIGQDLDPASLPATPADAAAVVDAICPAIELIEDRDADYSGGLDALSLVADNAWNAGIVLGDFRTAFPEPGNLAAEVTLDGETIDRGNSRDALGHPFAPVGVAGEAPREPRPGAPARRHRHDRQHRADPLSESRRAVPPDARGSRERRGRPHVRAAFRNSTAALKRTVVRAVVLA